METEKRMKTKAIIGLIGILLFTSVAFTALPAVLAKPPIDTPMIQLDLGATFQKDWCKRSSLPLREES